MHLPEKVGSYDPEDIQSWRAGVNMFSPAQISAEPHYMEATTRRTDANVAK